MRTATTIGILLALAAAPAAAAQDFLPDHSEDEDETSLWFRRPNVGYGPFHYVSLALIPSLRSGFEIRFPAALATDAFELRVTESWVKDLAVDEDWKIDFEVLRSNIALGWHVSDSLRIEGGVESANRTGGALDAFILGFHDTFGIAVGNRNQFSRNENRIEIRPPDGGPTIVVDRTNPQPYEQAALLTFQYLFTYGDESFPAVSASLSLRRELDQGDIQSDGPLDLSASLGLAKEVGPFHVYLGGKYSWFGRDSFFGLKLRTTEWATMAGVECNLDPSFALIGQFMVTSGGVDRLDHLSTPSFEVTAGFKWQISAGVLFELAIVENVIDFESAPDFGVHCSATFRW